MVPQVDFYAFLDEDVEDEEKIRIPSIVTGQDKNKKNNCFILRLGLGLGLGLGRGAHDKK